SWRRGRGVERRGRGLCHARRGRICAIHPRARLTSRPVLPAFDVRVSERDGVRIVEVEGEIDILTAPALAEALRGDGGPGGRVLDLGKVPFMSASGLRLILSAHRRLSRRGGLALAGVRRNVAHVLEVVGLV